MLCIPCIADSSQVIKGDLNDFWASIKVEEKPSLDEMLSYGPPLSGAGLFSANKTPPQD